MTDIGPYSNYRLTVRLELANTPGMFAKVAAVLAEEGANLGAVDIVSATADRMVPDVTFDVQNEAHGEQVLARIRALPDVKVLSASRPDFRSASRRKDSCAKPEVPHHDKKPAVDGLYAEVRPGFTSDRERQNQSLCLYQQGQHGRRGHRRDPLCWALAISARKPRYP